MHIYAGSTDMWSTSVGGHLMKVNLTGFTVQYIQLIYATLGCRQFSFSNFLPIAV